MAFSSDGVEASRVAMRRAGPADIPAVMAIERAPGFEAYVGRSEEADHRAMMASPGVAYRLGISPDGEPLAFAILSGLGDRYGNLYLKRVATRRPGEGIGTAFLTQVIDEAFGPLGAWRFFLDCFADNVRAQRAYATLGLSRDGLLRQAYQRPDGARADLILMAVLKPEWEAKRAARTA
jgi:RimJ/RimL family protein N-acetyltransferase